MEVDPKIITEAVWLFWETIGKEIVKRSTEYAWRQFRFREARQKYQKNVKALHSNMRVLYKLETVSLDNYYVDLFILKEPEAYRRYGINQLEASFDEKLGFYHRGDRSAALLVTEEHNRLFILGKPGAGKTTFLKHLTLLATDGKIDKVPIFISFRDWAYSEESLFEFIIKQFDICGFPNATEFVELLLEKGNAIFLFDGLDEVSEEGNQLNRMILELENLVNKYKDNKYIISCRNAANQYKFDGFTYVEIADLTDFQVSVFSGKWFNNNPTKSTEFLTQLAKEEHQSLKELSHNPLLLGMLCLVFDETSRFPPKRGMVYKEAINALIRRWDKDRGIQRDQIKGFSPSSEKKLLSFLAYEYFLENKIFFGQEDIEKKIKKRSKNFPSISVESEDILEAIEIQHGLITKRAWQVYTFSHLTFQEYFTAQYILDQLEAKQNILDDLFTRLHNQRWREVFPLVASLIPTPYFFFEKFITKIREPIKRDRALTRTIKNIDELSVTIQGTSDIITARMRAIALIIVIRQMLYVIQKTANKRSAQLGHKLLRLLNAGSGNILGFL